LIMLFADLVFVRHSLAALFSRSRSVRSQAKPPADTGTANQTVLLAGRSDNFRLAMLSSGLPGTPEEGEGLRAYILVDEFIIGRDEIAADLHLPVTTVGRQHAKIQRREGAFFLSDLGSKNGTSLDGRRLNKFEEYMLPDRCRLVFADQAFYFQVE
jgi:hypothetical protein